MALITRDQPIMLLFYPLCYAAVLTYHAQEQELWSDQIIILFMYKFAETIVTDRQFWKDCFIRVYLQIVIKVGS